MNQSSRALREHVFILEDDMMTVKEKRAAKNLKKILTARAKKDILRWKKQNRSK